MITTYKINVDKILKIKKEKNLMLKEIYLDLGIPQGSFSTYLKRGATCRREHYEKIKLWILKNEIALNKENKMSFYERGKK